MKSEFFLQKKRIRLTLAVVPFRIPSMYALDSFIKPCLIAMAGMSWEGGIDDFIFEQGSWYKSHRTPILSARRDP